MGYENKDVESIWVERCFLYGTLNQLFFLQNGENVSIHKKVYFMIMLSLAPPIIWYICSNFTVNVTFNHCLKDSYWLKYTV